MVDCVVSTTDNAVVCYILGGDIKYMCVHGFDEQFYIGHI